MAGPLTSRRRRAAALAVVLAVVGVHLWLSSRVAEVVGAMHRGAPPAMQRMDVAFVRELAPAAPPPPPARTAAAPAAPRRPATPRPPVPPASAASAPAAAAAAASEVPQEPPVEATTETETVAEAAGTAASEPAAAEPAASSALAAASAPVPAASQAQAGFEWPPSTRLDYVLTGNYRGEVHGHARVQWIRVGTRYQVHVDIVVGPGFAPLVSRRMTSEGEITAQGLEPRRYEEETTSLFGQPRRRAVRFDPERIVLDRGSSEPWPGVQDTASQFVQLTWLFTTQPELLRVGRTLDFPLALPRRVDRWRYDVVAEETLYTRIGEVQAFHVKPQRESSRPGELTAELWFAPSFQYLPVRVLIRHEGDTYVDLMVQSPPLQGE
ncbi:DUF3108 domain-containing protein [Aquincola sp. MAHUQ-54]|uniref:DUF3108 domain-containing protein n=1 Tax=Aquincola agrisoli TaxID=3119538 RepID=A0AAW9Q6Y2_9BURK